MIQNPFTSNSINPSTNNSNNSQGIHVNQAMSGTERAEVIKSLTNDMNAYLKRTQRLNHRLQNIEDELDKDSQISGSRIDWLAKQLNQDF